MIGFLKQIAEEKNDFKFGSSWRYSEDSLVALLPILRDVKKKREYLLLREAVDVEISDTGNINKVRVANSGKDAVYIRLGEIFTGKTQERMATRSYVVGPKETVDVEVRCIHASKGINSGKKMKVMGVVTPNIETQLFSNAFRNKSVSQNEVWSRVQFATSSMSASMSTSAEASTSPFASDDLHGTLTSFGKSIEKILKKVPYFENQVGLATLDLEGVKSIEAFDLRQSWKAFKDDIVRKQGEDIAKEQEDSPFEYKQRKAVTVVKKALQLDFEEKTIFKNQHYRVVSLNAEKYTGEMTELNGNVIHCVVIRKDK